MLALVVLVGALYLAHRDIIVGTPLEATADEHSLKRVFPPATGSSVQRLEEARRFADSLGLSLRSTRAVWWPNGALPTGASAGTRFARAS